MTKEELAKIREHIEIHSRKESHAIRITQIMKKALAELERIAELEKENAELKANNQFLNNLVREKEQRGLEIQEDFLRENEKLKAKVGLSIDCEKAQKNGELCLGYGGDEDEPCERCKNCIKCEGGYYQLGETEKDDQLTKAKDIIKDYMIIVKGGNITACSVPEENRCINVLKLNEQAEQFLSEVEK